MTLSSALKATERSLIMGSIRAVVRAGAVVAPGRTSRSIARRFFTTSRPSLERQAFRGARPRVGVMDVPDGKVTTYRWGEGDAPAVLLTHGWNGWAQQMEAFVAPLVERGFTVLAFDHVAHGLSDGQMTSLPAMIRSTGRVLDAQPNVVGAIAHSLGAGALASVLASTRRALAGAVLIAPPADPRPYLLGMARMLGAPERLLPDIQDHAEQTAGVAFERLAMQPWIARRIRTPLLVAHDVGDRDVPIAHGYAYTMGTGARLLATDGLGHTRILRDRHVVDSAVRFVTGRVRTHALALAA
ncbi:MAG TPA: alpha/beta fold hydrolase [Burkholderiaceae bacterium]|nr:alpha/beta fold hydrolase [Burkholderiaceae bacterium]